MPISNFKPILFCLIAMVILVTSEFSFAQLDDIRPLPPIQAPEEGGGAITYTLNNIVTALQGTLGKSIATIAVIVLGIGLFLGRISWPLAIATAVGIGLIFGAVSIIDWVSGGASKDIHSYSHTRPPSKPSPAPKESSPGFGRHPDAWKDMFNK